MKLEEVIASQLKKKIESGAVNDKINEKLDEFVDYVIGEALSKWSDTSKALSKSIGDKLSLNLDKLSLEQYNTVICKMVNERLSNVYVGKAQEHLIKIMDEVFQVPKKEYKLSELLDNVFKDTEEAQSCNEARGSLHIDNDYSDYYHIYFDEDVDKKKYDCDYNLFVANKKLVSAVKSTYRYGTKQIQPRPGDTLSSFDAMLFQAVVHESKVEVDVDEHYVDPFDY